MYDVLVIGWGKAGKTIALKAAKQHKKVAIIEKDPSMFGGTCINRACLPTKSLEKSAKIVAQAKKMGITVDEDQAFLEAMAKKDAMVHKLNQKSYSLLDVEETADIYIGEAKFLNNQEVWVNGEVLTAKNMIINTGSTPRRIGNYKTSEEILNLTKRPEKLLIVGAGFIGLEFASIFNNFGTAVTVSQIDDQFLPMEDEEDSKRVLEVLQNRGITFKFNQTEINDEGFDEVLVSIGRVPNTKNLGLENTDIVLGERGEIVVDENLHTSVDHIYAVGDVKGGAFFTYISLDDSRIVLPQIMGEKNTRTTAYREGFATATFIDPAYARVGLNEKQAQAKGIHYTKHQVETMAIPKAHVIGEPAGFSKILVDDEGYIIGATLYHQEAHEMINTLAIAIKEGIKFDTIKNFIYTHPTFSESLNDF
ncbi:Pyruvate/2-oxoglutarate dehydrogenase complex, dihydrolipoamide dehydrogenase (E3) component [Granulicatella balaenopterae]|uniref:Pyruvate/2-oxoglutarate dehydrogenase complex, dihydrolipoamide dehydrogenase (E3) component n=1 Tax=Granulicatella balaenopterae TaxID=137733 RepID=A0A1H9KF30_9LACT|nr:NAD(P)/FAD-dependent oxidoreductase [Granulicatella balaenopterae]SEQ97527.1 Pyruvate/2-oxoglutarate dehydrogenase complex, dihydrolipoamide dehydrogenase (E3) component [Granulicatella balaenopterae]